MNINRQFLDFIWTINSNITAEVRRLDWTGRVVDASDCNTISLYGKKLSAMRDDSIGNMCDCRVSHEFL